MTVRHPRSRHVFPARKPLPFQPLTPLLTATPLAQAIQRMEQPNLLTPAHVRSLQRSVGNHAVQRILSGDGASQTGRQMRVGPVDDPLEQQANRAATSAMRRVDGPAPVWARQDARLSQASADGGTVSAEMEQSIRRAQSGGKSLPATEQRSMEHALGADLSGVRVHHDAQADRLSRSLNARAFTIDRDLFFKSGEYNPGSKEGKAVLAHELTHVVQQQPQRARNRPGQSPVSPALTHSAAPTIQRLWSDVPLDYGVMKQEKVAGKFRTGSLKKWFGTSLKDAVQKFITAVRNSKEKEAKSALAELRKLLVEDSNSKILPTKNDKKNWDKNTARLAAATYYQKWIAAVDEHIQHANTSPLWMSEFQAHYGVDVNITPQLLQTHVQAYHKSRFYHMTRPGNVPGILNTGLDPNFGGTNRGLSEAHPDRETSETYKERSRGYVHLGKDYWSIVGMEQTLRDKYPTEQPQYLRAFIDEDERRQLEIDRDVSMGAYSVDEAGAVKTTNAIPSSVIYSGSFSNQTLQKQLAIANKIRDHYPYPKPSAMAVVQIHLHALQNQLIYTDDPNPYLQRGRRYSM